LISEYLTFLPAHQERLLHFSVRSSASTNFETTDSQHVRFTTLASGWKASWTCLTLKHQSI